MSNLFVKIEVPILRLTDDGRGRGREGGYIAIQYVRSRSRARFLFLKDVQKCVEERRRERDNYSSHVLKCST